MAFFDIHSYSAILDFCSVFYLLIDRYSGYVHFYTAFGEGNATHSSIIAWRTPGTEEPDGLLSTGSLRVGHD